MRLSKKLAAAVMSIGLMAGGITGVTALNDAVTPAAEAAGCSIDYSPWRLKARTVNKGCSGYALYYEYRKVNGKSRYYPANRAYKWQTSSFYMCYYGTYASGFAHKR